MNIRQVIIAPMLMLPLAIAAFDMDTPNTTGNEVNDTSRVYDIEEVVVVSQPKEVLHLRRQPVSSSSFDAKQMLSLGVQDLRELSAYVPSFVMPNYGSRYTSSMYIRGIGSRVNSPAVGIYVDGMPIQSKSAFNFHTYDIDRVDVLRGPQGSLYGINTEGGLVRLYSKNPMNYQGTDLTLSVGSHFWRKAEVAHYQKISDQVAFSLAGFYDGQNGFFRNTATGERADKFNEGGGKAHLVYNPTDRWTVNLLADYQYVRQNGFPYGLLEQGSNKAASPSTNRQGNYRRNMLNTGLGIDYRGNGFDFSSMTTYQYLKDYMLMDIDYLPQDYMHMEQRQFQNAFTQEFTFKGSQSLSSSHPDRQWHWVAGMFLGLQWLKTEAPVYFDPMMNTFLSQQITDYAYYGMYNAMVRRMVEAGMPQAAAEQQVAALIARAGGCTIDMQVETIPGLFRTPTYNLGFFHESNIDLTNRLTATIGLRYDYSHVGIEYATSARTILAEDVMGVHVDAVVSSILAQEEKDDFNQFLPKIGLSYRIDNNNSNVYATVAKGYRAGGYNIQMFSDILQTELSDKAQTARGELTIEHDAEAYDNIAKTISFKPEVSWNYEFGTHLNLFNNSVQFDFAGFFMQVKNQQLSVMAGNYGFGRMMVNAGESYSCGVEAALRGQAFDNRLSYALNYGYTRAVFKDYVDENDGVVIDYKDKRVPFVPEHTLAANADYRFDINGGALRTITLGANGAMQGKTYWDEANTYYQKIYATLGAHADFAFKLNKLAFNVNLWGRNLTNANYNTFAVQSAATGETKTFAQRGNPIQFGADVKLHF